MNCQPCLGSLRHKPKAMIASPGVRSASVPTTVTSRSSPLAASASASGRSGARRATVKPFSAFWYVIRSTTPRNSRRGRSWAAGASAMLQVSLEAGGSGKRPFHVDAVGRDDLAPGGFRGRSLFEGVSDSLLQCHRPALGPGGQERLLAQVRAYGDLI